LVGDEIINASTGRQRRRICQKNSLFPLGAMEEGNFESFPSKFPFASWCDDFLFPGEMTNLSWSFPLWPSWTGLRSGNFQKFSVFRIFDQVKIGQKSQI
jgi:hypothetical protein